MVDDGTMRPPRTTEVCCDISSAPSSLIEDIRLNLALISSSPSGEKTLTHPLSKTSGSSFFSQQASASNRTTHFKSPRA